MTEEVKKHLVSDEWIQQFHEELKDTLEYMQQWCNGDFLSSIEVKLFTKYGAKRPTVEIELSQIKKEMVFLNQETLLYEREEDDD